METPISPYENQYKELLAYLLKKADFYELEQPVEMIEIVKSHAQVNFAFNHDIFYELNNINLPRLNLYEPISRLSEQDIHQVTKLLTWLIYELKNWRKADDADYSKLKTSLIILNNFQIKLYDLLPSSVKKNTELLLELKNLVSSFNRNYSEIAQNNTPIWEQETIKEIEAVILNKDWIKFSKLWRYIECTQIDPNFFMFEMIRLLATLDFKSLCQSFHNNTDIFILMSVININTLTADQILLLAVESSNPLVEFIAFYRVLYSITNNRNELNEDESNKFVNILAKVSQDEIRFSAWMAVFNEYPMRYPLLQKPLGYFLANADSESMDSYIGSISLNTVSLSKIQLDNDSRDLVSICLEIFSKQASFEQRKKLWNKAFDRWSNWEFGIKNSSLMDISFSVLDFAVVGYFIECLSEQERLEYGKTIVNEMLSISTHWYPSITNFHKRWYQLISKFQLITHAISIKNKSWLMRDFYYTLTQFSNNSYYYIYYSQVGYAALPLS